MLSETNFRFVRLKHIFIHYALTRVFVRLDPFKFIQVIKNVLSLASPKIITEKNPHPSMYFAEFSQQLFVILFNTNPMEAL